MVTKEELRTITFTKLNHYYQSNNQVPMRHFVLISNLLKTSVLEVDETTTATRVFSMDPAVDEQLEQQWLDTCLDSLEEQEDYPMHEQDQQQENEDDLYCEDDDDDDNDSDEDSEEPTLESLFDMVEQQQPQQQQQLQDDCERSSPANAEYPFSVENHPPPLPFLCTLFSYRQED